MFASLLIFLFASLSPALLAMEEWEYRPPALKLPVGGEKIPFAVAVSSVDSNQLERASSITVAFTGSQPLASQGDDLVVTPHVVSELPPSSTHGMLTMDACDDLIVRSLFETMSKGGSIDTFMPTLKSMSDRGLCSAVFAIRILYKPEMNFSMSESEVEANFRKALSVFSSYQISNKSVYEYWTLKLSMHGLLGA
jgi:hypothetical protein